jgi:hypothetical protein
MILAHELARVLLAGPNAVVTTWSGEQDVDIEEIVRVDGHRCPVLVLGMEIRGEVLEGSETVWTNTDDQAHHIEVAKAKLAKARREAGDEAMAERAAE